jgi:hypothetical protein
MDHTTMTKRELAAALLTEVFATRDRISIAEVVALGDDRGVSRRTLTRAAQDLGVTEIHNGPFPGFWERPTP